jgi:hypothetical protein
MARGAQKLQSQQKNLQNKKKEKGSQLGSQAAAFKEQCASCRINMVTKGDYKSHWDAKHSKLPYPPELQ